MAEKRVGTLAVYLTANSQGVKKGFNEARGYISGFAKWTAGLAGGITAGAFLKSTVEAWGAAEQGANRLRAVLASTSGAVGLSQKQLEDYAAELQAATTYEDDAIIAMQTRLLTFGNLAGENFKRATALILDMAQATGQSAEGITAMIGKTLSNPAKYAEAMGKVGVSLTKAQITEIKKLTAAGKTYEAQLIILDELQRKFGGTAAAAADTTTGRLIQMKNAWGDVQEQIGRFLASVLSIKDQAGGVTSVFSGWATSLSENMGMLTEETLTYWAYLKYVLTLGGAMIKGILLEMIPNGLFAIPKYISSLFSIWVGFVKDIVTLISNAVDYAWGKITGKKVDFSGIFKFDSAMVGPIKEIGKIWRSVLIDPVSGMADAAGAAETELMAGLARAINKRNEIGREEQKKNEKGAPVVSAAPELKTVSEARKLVSAELFGSVEAYRTIKKAGLGDLQYKQVQIAEKSLGKLGEIADNTENAPELVEAM